MYRKLYSCKFDIFLFAFYKYRNKKKQCYIYFYFNGLSISLHNKEYFFVMISRLVDNYY